MLASLGAAAELGEVGGGGVTITFLVQGFCGIKIGATHLEQLSVNVGRDGG